MQHALSSQIHISWKCTLCFWKIHDVWIFTLHIIQLQDGLHFILMGNWNCWETCQTLKNKPVVFCSADFASVFRLLVLFSNVLLLYIPFIHTSILSHSSLQRLVHCVASHHTPLCETKPFFTALCENWPPPASLSYKYFPLLECHVFFFVVFPFWSACPCSYFTNFTSNLVQLQHRSTNSQRKEMFGGLTLKCEPLLLH